MPASDLKITALTALTAADPANDVLPIVDVSDNSMAASGTTKKISINNILACSPAATLASATITGDLTVKTNVLKVDTTNNRVGIGTASPGFPLHILNNTAATNTAVDVLLISQTSTGTPASGLGGGLLFRSQRPSGGLILNRGAIYGVSGADPDDDGDLAFYTLTNTGASGFTEKYRLDSNGVATWSNVGGIAGTAMTLNATGLLVGTANNFASSRLCVQGTAGTSTPDVTIGIPVNSSGNTNLSIGRSASTNGYIFLDAYKAGVGGTELVLNSVNGGTVLVGLSTVVAAGGCLQLKSGITFPATQVASSDANTLDDYEEGTFTATLRGFNVEPATKLTATCRYTKVGRLVNVVGDISGDTTGYAGVAYITGLPFVTGAACSGAANGNYIDLKTRTSLGSVAVNADTAVYFLAVGSTVGTVYAEHNAGAGRSFSFNITYYV